MVQTFVRITTVSHAITLATQTRHTTSNLRITEHSERPAAPCFQGLHQMYLIEPFAVHVVALWQRHGG